MPHAPTSARPRLGSVAVLVALLLVALFGVLAIALDGGLLQDNRRRVQAAADAAALAAATELYKSGPAIAASNDTTLDPGGRGAAAARSWAAANGFPDDGTTSSVVVNIPPAGGAFAGKAGYAEVTITYHQPRYFSGVWGGATLPVSARAVARGRWGGTGTGILILDPSAKDALDASGTGGVTVTGGASVIVDSGNGEAARATGGGALTAPDFEITGGYTGWLGGAVHTGVPPTPDPLRYLPAPAVPPDGMMTVLSLGNGNKRYTLTPGRYTNLPTFTSGDEVVFEQASCNGNGGVFYIDGGGFKSTGATIKMDPYTSGGILIYNSPRNSANSEEIHISGNASGSVDLSPLTAGPYAGLLLWQDRASNVPLAIAGSGAFRLEGTFYAANAQLQITGNGAATIGSQYISRTLSLSGNGAITIDYKDTGTARQREVLLVE
jgi:hypothetical protein